MSADEVKAIADALGIPSAEVTFSNYWGFTDQAKRRTWRTASYRGLLCSQSDGPTDADALAALLANARLSAGWEVERKRRAATRSLDKAAEARQRAAEAIATAEAAEKVAAGILADAEALRVRLAALGIESEGTP